MQSSYEEKPANESETEQTMCSVLPVDFDIGPVRVPALTDHWAFDPVDLFG
jgi:hypothetical protein